MSPAQLLIAYGAALFIFSVAGGALPRRIEMTHTRTQLAMSLVSGLMLGIAFFHLLPHAVLTLGVRDGLNVAMGWVMLGLIVMLLLLRILHFHHPDYANEVVASCDHEHGDAHEHRSGDSEAVRLPVAAVNWKGVLTGLTFHSFIDGVALGAAFIAVPHGHSDKLLGFGVFIAILLHKPLDAMSITALMKSAGTSPFAQQSANLLFALVCPLGAFVFYFFAFEQVAFDVPLVAAALAFSAGAFICIALSDLLPEVQFHSHDRVKLTAVFLFGIGISYLMANTAAEHSHDVYGILGFGAEYVTAPVVQGVALSR